MNVKAAEKTADIKILSGAETVVPVLAFAVPFLVSGPQWLTGTLVNFFLYLSVRKLSGRTLLMVVILPSVGVLMHGALFGKFTPFLAFFLPFIWLGNLVMIRTFMFFLKSLPAFFAVFLSAILKSLWLYVIAVMYFSFNLVPQMFVTAMGFVQFLTAFSGGLIALMILRFIKIHE